MNRSDVFNLTMGRRSAVRYRKYHWILGRRPDDRPGLSNLNL
ncbi:MAG: hypothetical protein V7K31_28915 [Nostoc sp.]